MDTPNTLDTMLKDIEGMNAAVDISQRILTVSHQSGRVKMINCEEKLLKLGSIDEYSRDKHIL